jgi:hypothetical protein
MTPPSSYVKIPPYQPMQCHSDASLKHIPANTPNFNTNGFHKKFLFFFNPYIGVPDKIVI